MPLIRQGVIETVEIQPSGIAGNIKIFFHTVFKCLLQVLFPTSKMIHALRAIYLSKNRSDHNYIIVTTFTKTTNPHTQSPQLSISLCITLAFFSKSPII
jgi:hypothetical protein